MKHSFSSIILNPPSYVGFLLLVFLILSFTFSSFCQKLSIEGFTSEPFDLSSRTNQVKDNNNLSCALIKIVCNDEIIGVQGSVVKSEEYGNEYWIHLPNGTKYIKVLTRHHPPLDFKISDYLTNGVVTQSTYQLNLKSDLPPEVLYGSSNPLAPVAMAKDTDPLFPRWWNTHEDGIYVGISLPTLDGETAKIAAVTNALYSFLHSTGCHIVYTAEITKDQLSIKKDCRAVCMGFEKGFAISILHEYYNSKGEYFVLCAIKSDVKSSNKIMIDWAFNDNDTNRSLSVNIDLSAKINRFPLASSMQYEVSWLSSSQKYNLSCNGKVFMHDKDIELHDHISDFILSGDIGLTQLRLLTTFPLLPDTISAILNPLERYLGDDLDSSTTYIAGKGKSKPLNIQLSDYSVRGLTFGVHERFPDVKFKYYDDSNIISQTTGLSEKYNREYWDSRGNVSAVEGHGFCDDHELFEAKRNNSLLRALSEGVMAVSENTYYGNNMEAITEFNVDSSWLKLKKTVKAKMKIYPLYYLDPNERIDCKKKYRKEWESHKNRYQHVTSVVIPIESININIFKYDEL